MLIIGPLNLAGKLPIPSGRFELTYGTLQSSLLCPFTYTPSLLYIYPHYQAAILIIPLASQSYPCMGCP